MIKKSFGSERTMYEMMIVLMVAGLGSVGLAWMFGAQRGMLLSFAVLSVTLTLCVFVICDALDWLRSLVQRHTLINLNPISTFLYWASHGVALTLVLLFLYRAVPAFS